MPQDLVDSLTVLRQRVITLAATLHDDLRPFLQTADLTFRRLPNTNGSVSVSTTCSALMALALTRQIQQFYKSKAASTDASDRIKTAFLAVVSSDWKSSNLKEKNAFTTAMVLRAAGILHKYKALPEGFKPEEVKHKTQSLKEIALEFAHGVPESFSVQNYPSTPAIGYWFIDAIDNLGIELDDDIWVTITEWVSKVFAKQLSLVSARHDAMMDPVEMAMAASLASRIHRIAASPTFKERDKVASELPSLLELQHALRLLFKFQGDSGIWPKYFPLFHYPDVGANYCFSFELLEVLIHEFAGTGLLEEEPILIGFEKAIAWCEDNRFEYYFDGNSYHGWNSGGQLTTLSRGIPESWATAVIHMFLCRLRRSLSQMIENRTLERYGTRRIHPAKKDSSKWDRLLDSPVWLPGDVHTSVQQLIQKQIIDPIESSGDNISRQRPLRQRRSALLFGPPGTSKTTLVRAIAGKIGWPLVELNPSHFLRQGLEHIYVRANEIFDDLLNLSKAVVMFDEMDALAQRRVEHLDLTRQLLTTSMLPKLSMLHDQAQVLFFMATNHQRNFDDAIKRPGRFDLLICMGPSLWEEKLKGLNALWVGPKGSENDVEAVRKKLTSWVGKKGEDSLRATLDLFTFGEMREFFEYLRQGGDLRVSLERMSKKDFRNKAEKWGKNYITLREREGDKDSIRKEYEEDRISSRVQ